MKKEKKKKFQIFSILIQIFKCKTYVLFRFALCSITIDGYDRCKYRRKKNRKERGEMCNFNT